MVFSLRRFRLNHTDHPPPISEEVEEVKTFSPEEIISLIENDENLFENPEQSILALISSPPTGLRKANSNRIKNAKSQYTRLLKTLNCTKKCNTVEITADSRSAESIPHICVPQYYTTIRYFDPSISKNVFCCNSEYLVCGTNHNTIVVSHLSRHSFISTFTSSLHNLDLTKPTLFELIGNKLYINTMKSRTCLIIGKESLSQCDVRPFQVGSITNGVSSLKYTFESPKEISISNPIGEGKIKINIETHQLCFNGSDLFALDNKGKLTVYNFTPKEIRSVKSNNNFKGVYKICHDPIMNIYWIISNDNGWKLKCCPSYDQIDPLLFNTPMDHPNISMMASKRIIPNIEIAATEDTDFILIDYLIKRKESSVTTDFVYRYIDLHERDIGLFLLLNNLEFMSKDKIRFMQLLNIFINNASPLQISYAMIKFSESNILCDVELYQHFQSFEKPSYQMLIETQLDILMSTIYTLLTEGRMTFRDEVNLIQDKFEPLMRAIIKYFINNFKEENTNTPIVKLVKKLINFLYPLTEYFEVSRYTSICFSDLTNFILNNFEKYKKDETRDFAFDVMKIFALSISSVIGGGKLHESEKNYIWFIKLFNNPGLGEIKEDIQEFIDNDENEKMKLIYEVYKSNLNRKLSNETKRIDRVVLMAIAHIVGIQDEVLSYDGKERTASFTAALYEMMNIRNNIKQQHKDDSDFKNNLINKALILLKMSSSAGVSEKSISKFLQSTEKSEEIILLANGFIDKVQNCFRAFDKTQKSLSEYSMKNFSKELSSIFTSTIADVQSFANLATMLEIAYVQENGKRCLFDFFNFIFNFMKTTKDFSMLRLVYKFCKSINIPEVSDYIFNRMHKEEELISEFTYPFFAVKYVMTCKMASIPDCIICDIERKPYNMILINKFSQHHSFKGEFLKNMYSNICSFLTNKETPHLRVACDIITNLFIQNECSSDSELVLSYVHNLIKDIGLSLNSYQFSYASELIRIIRKVMTSNSIHREIIKQFLCCETDDTDTVTGVIAVIGMYSETCNNKRIARVVGTDGMKYVSCKGTLYNYPIQSSNKKIPCKKIAAHIEPDNLLPFDVDFFNVIINYKHFFVESSLGDVFNLVFLQAYSYYMRFNKAKELVQEYPDIGGISIEIEKMIPINDIADNFNLPSVNPGQQNGLNTVILEGSRIYVTDPFKLDKKETTILFSSNKNQKLGISFIIPSCEFAYEHFLPTVFLNLQANRKEMITINTEKKKIYFRGLDPLDIPVPCDRMHVTFRSRDIKIYNQEQIFDNNLTWDYHKLRLYKDEEEPSTNQITCDPDKQITIIPNSSGNNVSDGLKIIYIKSIIKKLIAQWSTVIAAQYMEMFDFEKSDLLTTLFRALLFSFHPSPASTFSIHWKRANRIDGLPYGLDTIVAKALTKLSDIIVVDIPDLCMRMCKAPENLNLSYKYTMDSSYEICLLLKFMAFKQPNDSAVLIILKCFIDICNNSSNKNALSDLICVFQKNPVYYKALTNEVLRLRSNPKCDGCVARILQTVYSGVDEEVTMQTELHCIKKSIRSLSNENISQIFSMAYKFGSQYTDESNIPRSAAFDLWGSASGTWDKICKITRPWQYFEDEKYVVMNPSNLNITIIVNPSIYLEANDTIFVGDCLDDLTPVQFISSKSKTFNTSSPIFYISTAGCNSREDDVSIQINLSRKDLIKIVEMEKKPKLIEDEEALRQFREDTKLFAVEWGINDSNTMREELENKTVDDIPTWISSTKIEGYSKTVLTMRARLFFLINDIVPSLQNDPQMIILFRLYPHFFSKKSTFIMIRNDAKERANYNKPVRINIDRMKDQNLIDGNSINVEDSFIQQISRQLNGHVLGNNFWYILYKDEAGVDAGGLRRDAFHQAFTSFFHPSSKLVEPCFNKKNNKEDSDFFLPITTLKKTKSLERVYSTFGQLLAVILLTGYNQYIPFPSIVWKLLFDKESIITVKDIKSIDEKFCSSKHWTCDDWFGNEIVLEGHSKDDEVDDKEQYESECIKFRVIDLMYFIDSMRSGFLSVYNNIKFFGRWENIPNTLQNKHIDINVLIKYLDFHGPMNYMRMFINVIKQFSQDELKLLLKFTTGTAFIPIYSNEFNLVVKCLENSENLPVAHTCFNRLDLPMYDTEEKMAQKIRLAISNCTNMELV